MVSGGKYSTLYLKITFGITEVITQYFDRSEVQQPFIKKNYS